MMTEEITTKHGKRSSERTCAGCGKRDAADALVRVVLDPSTGEIAADLSGSGFGRGAHVHASASCLVKAAKGGFAKAFKAKVVCEAKALGADLVRGAERRIEGLLAGAKRGKLVVFGADAVREAVQKDDAALVVVARDAAAAAQIGEVQRMIDGGRAVALFDKKRLGALFGKEEVAVCAVLDAGVAQAIASAEHTAQPFRGDAWWSPEVR